MLSQLLPAIGIRAAPEPDALRTNLKLSLFFAMVFGVVYIGADLLSVGVSPRLRVAFDFEAGIPFVPQMAIAYLSIIPLLFLALFVLTSPRRLFPLVFVLSLEVIVAGILFLLFPVEETFPPRQVEGASAFLFTIADTLNLRYNDLPSLHIALSLSAAFAYSQYCDAVGKIFYLVWALLIAASSVLTHQHHLADVAAGALLASAGMGIVYPLVARPAILDALRIELICATEFWTFSRRQPRYLVIAFIIYWHSLFRWRQTRVMRVGFCLLQAIDDLLDGDRQSESEPADIAADIVKQLQTGEFRSGRLAILARALAGALAPLRTDTADPLANAIALIRHMMVDRDRARKSVLFDTRELRRHHQITFHHSLNLLLIAVGAKARAADVPDLIEAFGWCSTMRDLREDLAHGLVNIPLAVVEAAADEGTTLDDVDQLCKTQAIRAWQIAELGRATQKLRAFSGRDSNPADRAGNRVLGIFYRSITAFARRVDRQLSHRV